MAETATFRVESQRAVTWDRLGAKADVLPSGHLNAVARPQELVGCVSRDSTRKYERPVAVARWADTASLAAR
jgi:hypothetical protein